MTSEVLIVNKLCVAVAADSAVTRNQNKIHTTANKVFQLIKNHPVGIVVYNNAELAGLPWELLIKMFRDCVKDDFPDTIDIISEKFINFISESRFLTERAGIEELGKICFYISKKMCDKTLLFQNKSFSSELKKRIDKLTEAIEQESTISNYQFIDKKNFNKLHSDFCFNIFENFFKKYNKKLNKKLKSIISNLVYKYIISSGNTEYDSGVAIFGYGKNEIMASVCNMTISCAPLSKLRIIEKDLEDHNRHTGGNACVYTLAQQDISGLFMENIHPEMKNFYESYFRQLMNRFSSEIFSSEFSNKIPDDEKIVSKKLVQEMSNKLIEKFITTANDYIAEKSANPILNELNGLGVEDMAKLAEALVEFTSLKRKVSKELETVGGPIDVAILTKTDGFTWVKRKNNLGIDKGGI